MLQATSLSPRTFTSKVSCLSPTTLIPPYAFAMLRYARSTETSVVLWNCAFSTHLPETRFCSLHVRFELRRSSQRHPSRRPISITYKIRSPLVCIGSIGNQTAICHSDSRFRCPVQLSFSQSAKLCYVFLPAGAGVAHGTKAKLENS